MKFYISRTMVYTHLMVNGVRVEIADAFGHPGMLAVAPVFDNLSDLAEFHETGDNAHAYVEVEVMAGSELSRE